MNLNSLPDEMIGNVLKYTTLSRIRRLRKLNRRIDKIARRFGMTKILANSFWMNTKSIRIYLNKSFLEESEREYFNFKYIEIPVADKFSCLKLMEKVLPVILILSRFVMHKCLDFDEDVYKTINKNQKSFKKLISIELSYIRVVLSMNLWRSFFDNICCNANSVVVREIRGAVENLLDTKVFETREWSRLDIDTAVEIFGDPFLLDFVPNIKCRELIWEKPSFTITGVANTFKELLHSENRKQTVRLSEVLLGNMPPSNVKHLFKLTEPGLIMKCNYHSRYYQVTFKGNDRVIELKFNSV